MKLRAIDLFSGIGAFSLGLQRAGGIEPAAFCEIDTGCQRTLAKHWPDRRIFTDVRSLGREHVAHLGATVLTAGFPCQDLSSAGPGSGLSGPRSGLFWEVVRALRMVRPCVLLLENVATLLGRGMDSVLGALAENGYDAEWDCVRAFDAGAPHRRDRLYIAAYAEGDGWGPGRPGGLADGLAGLPNAPCWDDDPVRHFEERYAEPALLGVDDAPADRLDRIGRCGNALIPDIPEAIGRALLADLARRDPLPLAGCTNDLLGAGR